MAARDVPRALSPIEQGLLLHYFYDSDSDSDSVYVDQMVCDIVGPLDVRRLDEAVRLLIEAHQALRTTYHRGPGAEMSAVVRAPAAPRITVVDLSGEADARAVVDRRVAADGRTRLDIARQVSRCVLFRLDEWSHVFAWTYHHVVADSWTLRLLTDQFCAAYRTLEPPRATPYAAYVDWIARRERDPAATAMGRITPRRFPTGTGGRDRVRVSLPAATRALVDDIRRRHRVTTSVVLLGVWGILALDQLAAGECLLGCVVSGRTLPLPGIETVAGVCANTVPILIDGSRAIPAFLAGLRRDLLSAGARSHLAISDVLAAAGLSHHDLHSVVNFTIDERTVRNRHVDHLPFDITNVRYTQAANFDAYLDVEAHEAGVDITVDFDPARRFFEAGEAGRRCERIVRRLAGHPGDTVRDVLDALPAGPGRFDAGFAFDAHPGRPA